MYMGIVRRGLTTKLVRAVNYQTASLYCPQQLLPSVSVCVTVCIVCFSACLLKQVKDLRINCRTYYR